MRPSSILTAVALCCATAVGAQQPDTTSKRDSTRRAPRSAADSAAKADSAARADSIFIEQQLRGGAGAAPSGPATPQPATGSTGPINPRLLPDVSAVGDLIADLSPDGSTQEDGSRFGIREVEVAIQAAVDPYFRGDVFIGLNDVEKVTIEQAYLTTTSLPYGLEVRLGRYLMPFGKQNLTHRHDLHTIEYPYVIQRFFGPEGLKGTGLWVSKIFSPFGFYQELQLTAVDRYGEAPEGLTTERPMNRRLSGLAYTARLRNYVDFTQAANLELSASAITGRREQPLACDLDPLICPSFNAVGARQSVLAADATYRWRPLQQGLYKSFILQAEVMRQLNDATPELPSGAPVAAYAGPSRDATGAYVFARYQLGQRLFVGSRYDHVGETTPGEGSLGAASGYIEWFPSEFSKLVAGYERVMPGGVAVKDSDRILLQASFAVGPHKPHPF